MTSCPEIIAVCDQWFPCNPQNAIRIIALAAVYIYIYVLSIQNHQINISRPTTFIYHCYMLFTKINSLNNQLMCPKGRAMCHVNYRAGIVCVALDTTRDASPDMFSCLRGLPLLDLVACSSLQLPAVACSSLQLPAVACSCLEQPTIAWSSLQLPAVAYNCLQQPTVACSSLQLRAVA